MPTPQFLPSDLGFDPEIFPSYRDGQLDLSLQVAESRRRFTFIEVPPGGGKSLAYMTVPKILSLGDDTPLRTLVLVGTKGLQSQLSEDFHHAFTVYGHSNYRCLAVEPGGPLYPEYRGPMTCDVGPCRIGVECQLRGGGCESYDARYRASKSEVVLANYALWMSINRYGEPNSLGQFDVLVLDEAHTARDWLTRSCVVSLLASDLRPFGISLPPAQILDDPSQWSKWAGEAASVVRAASMIAKRTRRLNPREVVELQRLEADLGTLAAVLPDGPTRWIADTTSGRSGPGVEFSPVWAQEFAERYLFRGIPKVILSSATLSPLDARYLGIPTESFDYLERPSTFPARNRPLIYVPGASVRRGMPEAEIRMWVNVIDRIIEKRLDRKGIIHTRSYDYARQILKRSKYARFLISHNDSRDIRAQIAAFKSMDAPAVFVSPSIEEGFDFPDDEARYVIIAKLPFLDLSDAVTAARMEADKTYSVLVTAQTIIQMYGRGVRSRGDWAETFIIDESWGRWFRAAAGRLGLWHRWFKDAWQDHDYPPPPPALQAA